MKHLPLFSFRTVFRQLLMTRLLSRWIGRIANTPLYPPLLRWLIRKYVIHFQIDLSQFEFDYKKVTTFNAFFTRRLKQGVRQWENGICSPVDGRILSSGKIHKGKAFQVKGMNYSVRELLGEEKGFKGGSFVNLYLSPADYHRVHAPFDMHFESATHIPGRLLSVSANHAATVPDLYAKNERVILSGSSAYGRFHFVFVGALNVGSIRLSSMPVFRSNRDWTSYRKMPFVRFQAKGSELGWFELGSTVVMILESDKLSEIPADQGPVAVRLGQALVQEETPS